MKKITVIITATTTLLVGLGIGWLLFRNNGSQETQSREQSTESSETIWTCAMHPQIRQNEPGLCPICNMDLTPLQETSAASDPNLLQLSENAAQLANVQTSIIGYGDGATKTITLQGKIEIDERTITKIPAHFHGRIEKLYVNFTGETVSKDQLLAEVYSPELITAQQELLQALEYKESNPSLYKATRNKLAFWKISDVEIDRIEQLGEIQNTIRINAHHGGVVIQRHVTLGDHVNMGDILFEIADLSCLWVLFDAYEKDLQWIKKGANIRFTVASLPGQTFNAQVSFIDPLINPQTRVANIRAEVMNIGGLLKPEMFVNGNLAVNTSGKESPLLVPQSAVLWTGTQSLVYIKKPEFDQPTFEYRQITIGPTTGNYYIVESGLSAGEEIVTNGTFTIDAAAQLSGKTSMMNPKDNANANPMQGMDMGDMKMDEPKDNVTQKAEAEAVETTFWVGGTCGMCKDRIEGTLGKVPGILSSNWNLDTKMLTVSYDKSKLTEMNVHKALATVGHDTEKIKTADDVYDNLMGCCKYERNPE